MCEVAFFLRAIDIIVAILVYHYLIIQQHFTHSGMA